MTCSKFISLLFRYIVPRTLLYLITLLYATFTVLIEIDLAKLSFDLLPNGCFFSGASISFNLILYWVLSSVRIVIVSPSDTFTTFPISSSENRLEDIIMINKKRFIC